MRDDAHRTITADSMSVPDSSPTGRDDTISFRIGNVGLITGDILRANTLLINSEDGFADMGSRRRI